MFRQIISFHFYLFIFSYSPIVISVENNLKYYKRGRNFYVSKYDHFVYPGGFITETSKRYIQQFCSFKSLIKEPKCLKNIDYLFYLYLILTNHQKKF